MGVTLFAEIETEQMVGAHIPTVEGVQPSEMVDDDFEIESRKVPVLAPLLMSPLYVAVIVTGEDAERGV